jgi:nitrite reductase/ring-hydroxylating ferredoxin subunit
MERVYVATDIELEQAGVIVVRAGSHNVAVFQDGSEVFAVDNRCPHMGFPLDRGTVRDGMLTCHWHQARFDLKSGCTFDLWADDVPRFETAVEDGKIFVAGEPSDKPSVAVHKARLVRGLEQNVALVIAKSLLSLLEAEVPVNEIGDAIVKYAGANLGMMSEGLTRLGCVLNLWPYLSFETGYQSLYYATRQVAAETTAAVPHRDKPSLKGAQYDAVQLKGWMTQWVRTRHRDGAERTLMTADQQVSDSELADIIFTSASVRPYAAGGHLFEDCNKVLEFHTNLGGGTRAALLPLLIERMTQARGEEEATNWHHPVEIAGPLADLDAELPDLLAENPDGPVPDDIIDVILGDDPLRILAALRGSQPPMKLLTGSIHSTRSCTQTPCIRQCRGAPVRLSCGRFSRARCPFIWTDFSTYRLPACLTNAIPRTRSKRRRRISTPFWTYWISAQI